MHRITPYKLTVDFTAVPASGTVGETVTLRVTATNATGDESLYNVSDYFNLDALLVPGQLVFS